MSAAAPAGCSSGSCSAAAPDQTRLPALLVRSTSSAAAATACSNSSVPACVGRDGREMVGGQRGLKHGLR
jgi:hypothetical protein